MKPLLPLLLLPVVTLADFPGVIIPETPGSDLDKLPCEASGNFSGSNGYGGIVWARDWCLAFDGEAGTFPNNAANALTFDAGTPRTLSGVRRTSCA